MPLTVTPGSGAQLKTRTDGSDLVVVHDAVQAGTWTMQPGNTPNTSPWLFTLSLGGVSASILDYTNSKPLAVRLTDTNGDYVAAAGGSQYAEDSAHTSGHIGTMALVVRSDAGGALAGTDGDYAPLQVDANGALRVTGGGGGTEYTEDAAAAANPVGQQLMLRRRDTLTGSEVSADGDVIAANATAAGELYVKVTDNVTVVGTGTLAVQAVCTNAGTFAVQAAQSGTWTVDLGATDNAVLDAIAASLAGTLTVGLPSGAATDASLGTIASGIAAILTGPISIDDNGGSITVDGTVAISGSVAVTGTFWQATQPVSNAGTFAVQAAQSGAWTVDLGATDNAVLDAIAASLAGTLTVGLPSGAATEASLSSLDGKVTACNTGAVVISSALPAGTNTVGGVVPVPATSGGLSMSRDLDLDNGTLTVVKSSPGQLYGFTITNRGTVPVYVKFYDATSGTLGSGTPVLTFEIPANASDHTTMLQSFGGHGLAFATGICVGAGTGIADVDNTDPGANIVLANVYYK